ISFFKDAGKTTTLPGVRAVANRILRQTDALDARQRIAFRYDVIFGPGDAAFADLNQNKTSETIYVSAGRGPYVCDAQIELRSTVAPYTLDGDPYWLSQDICVFRVRQDGTDTVFGVKLDSQNANPPIKFIQDVLNSPGSIAADFDQVRDWDQ